MWITYVIIAMPGDDRYSGIEASQAKHTQMWTTIEKGFQRTTAIVKELQCGSYGLTAVVGRMYAKPEARCCGSLMYLLPCRGTTADVG